MSTQKLPERTVKLEVNLSERACFRENPSGRRRKCTEIVRGRRSNHASKGKEREREKASKEMERDRRNGESDAGPESTVPYARTVRFT